MCLYHSHKTTIRGSLSLAVSRQPHEKIFVFEVRDAKPIYIIHLEPMRSLGEYRKIGYHRHTSHPSNEEISATVWRLRGQNSKC